MLLDELFNLTEAFNTTFSDISWKVEDGAHIGYATLHDIKYIMLIEPGVMEVNNTPQQFYNIAFATHDGSDYTTTFRNSGVNSSQVYGAIKNGLENKLDSLPPVNFLIFAAKNDYHENGALLKSAEDKLKLYKRMITSKLYGMRDYNYIMTVEISPTQQALVASRHSVSKNSIEDIKQHIVSKGMNIFG